MLVDDNKQPIHGADVVGELAIRGLNVMKGYLNQPVTTAEVCGTAGCGRGDLVQRDLDGNYYIVDRAKDLIVRAGFNVYPREIEEVLMTHSAGSLATVVGMPDERTGVEVVAFVICDPGAEPVAAVAG